MRDLPLFPLDTVLFPHMPIHLHIFELRYQLMINKCIEEKHPFGVVLIRRGNEVGGEKVEPYPIGTTAVITQVEKLAGGRMNIVAVGDDRFNVTELVYDEPYLTAKVECLPLQEPVTLDVARRAHHLRPLVEKYLGQVALANRDEVDVSQIPLPDDPLLLFYLSSTLLQLPALEKQPLLAAETAADMLAKLIRLYRRETALMDQLYRRIPIRPEWN